MRDDWRRRKAEGGSGKWKAGMRKGEEAQGLELKAGRVKPKRLTNNQ